MLMWSVHLLIKEDNSDIVGCASCDTFSFLLHFGGFLPAISTPGGKKHCGEQNYSVWCLNQTESTKYRKFMCKP